MANKKLGEKLRELRNIKNYTQQQVSDMLGLKNKSTLGSWEIGKSEPNVYFFLKLCGIYGVENIYEAFHEKPVRTNTNMDNVSSEIYDTIKDLSKYEKLYILDSIKFYKKHLEQK